MVILEIGLSSTICKGWMWTCWWWGLFRI